MNALFAVTLLVLSFHSLNAIVPSGEILVEDTEQIQFGAPAHWGKKLPQEYETIFRQLVKPTNGTTGCNPVVKDDHVVDEGFYLLSERGECSFEHKAHAAANIGALGLIVYNSPKGVYRGKNYAPPEEYECKNGEGWVRGSIHGNAWSPNSVAEIPRECYENSSCASQRCLYTNITKPGLGTKVCCAWDIYIRMGPDQQASSKNIESLIDQELVDIPVVFITMKEGEYLLNFLSDKTREYIGVAMFARPLPPIDLASLTIWLIAMITVAYAAEWISKKELSDEKEKKGRGGEDGMLTDDGDSTYSEIEDGPPPSATNADGTPNTNAQNDEDEETIDITPGAALFFVLIASCTLILFFYFDLSVVILIIYILGATISISVVFIHPILLSEMKSGRRDMDNSDCIFLLALIVSVGICLLWYFQKSSPWSWVLQDFMGASVCLCFLYYIRLPNLEVATVLLCLAFVYDVFFVFITPYFFGSSVMVQVAQGGDKPQHTDPNFCEKYPSDKDCADTTAPNLIVVPSINDYRGGTCMLGLGDIILPGLFLVLVARIDVRQRGYLIDDDIFDGLFGISIIGYGIALILANQAVQYFQFGQPALLYIVPLLLIPVLWRTYDDGSISELWEKLPLPRTVAQPLGNEERRRLLAGRSDVINVSASWGAGTDAGEPALNMKVSRPRSKKKLVSGTG